MRTEERTSLIDLGWCVARLTEQKGLLSEDDASIETWNKDKEGAAWHPYSLTLFSPSDSDCPAQSICIYGLENVKKLAAFLAPLTAIKG